MRHWKITVAQGAWSLALLAVLAVSYQFFFVKFNPQDLRSVQKWFILLDYDQENSSVDFNRIKEFEMAVLDPDQHLPLEHFQKGAFLIAYLSLGEAEDYRFYWNNIKKQSWVLNKNPNWEGNYYVDVRSQQWQELVMNHLIPKIIEKGFRGIMLDTVDTAAMLEQANPGKYLGMREAMVDLIKNIHEKYPQLLLLTNNGFELLSEVAPFLSGLVVEDVYQMIDFKAGGYTAVPESDREWKLGILRNIQRKFSLPVFCIDYADEDERESVSSLHLKIKKLGFKPYIAEGFLSRIYNQELILNQ